MEKKNPLIENPLEANVEENNTQIQKEAEVIWLGKLSNHLNINYSLDDSDDWEDSTKPQTQPPDSPVINSHVTEEMKNNDQYDDEEKKE